MPATTWYVTKTGNDTTGDGTVGTPYLTITKTISVAADGDTINVGIGTYDETVEMAVAAQLNFTTSGAVIVRTIEATNAKSVFRFNDGSDGTIFAKTGAGSWTIDGTNSDEPAKHHTYAIWIAANADSLSFSNCTFTTSYESGAYVVWFNGANAGCTFTNCTVSVPAGGNGIYSNSATTITCMTCTFTYLANSVLTVRANTSASGTWTFTGCTFNTDAFTGGYCISNEGNANLVVTGCTFNVVSPTCFNMATAGKTTVSSFTNNTFTFSGAGVGITASNGTHTLSIRNNIFTTTSTGIMLSIVGGTIGLTCLNNTFNVNTSTATRSALITVTNQTGSIIEDNIFNTLTETANAADAINVNSTGTAHTGLVIRGNTIKTARRGGHGILVGTDGTTNETNITDAIVENNRIYGSIWCYRTAPATYTASDATTTLHAIEIGCNPRGVVRNNYVEGCGYGVVIKNVQQDWAYGGGVFGNTFVDNVINGIYIKGAVNVQIAKNTIVLTTNPSAGSLADWQGLIGVSANTETNYSTGSRIRDNILYGRDTFYLIWAEDANNTIAICNRNCLWSNDPTTTTAGDKLDFYYAAGALANIAAWQALGFDAISVIADPKFVNLAGYDFRLRVNSPCINAGNTTTGLTMTTANLYRQQNTLGSSRIIYSGECVLPNDNRMPSLREW